MVIYGILTETDIGKLFAAVLPASSGFSCTWRPCGSRPSCIRPDRHDRAAAGRRFASLTGVLPVLRLFFFVFGGQYAGVFTPTGNAIRNLHLGCCSVVLRRRPPGKRPQALRESSGSPRCCFR
jgi:TRAP-type C4-dicarboxylate transport system permease large subunit